MFKKTDPNPQLDIFTAPSMQLGSRASKKYSDPNAWHNQFYSHVTTKIDEEIFKPLFPECNKSCRPKASIRILVTMSVLKEDSSKTVYRSGTPPSPSSTTWLRKAWFVATGTTISKWQPPSVSCSRWWSAKIVKPQINRLRLLTKPLSLLYEIGFIDYRSRCHFFEAFLFKVFNRGTE